MIDAPLALAFTAGMVATVNPCGFAMLPAYLGYFLGVDQESAEGARPGPLRAVGVATAASGGFLVVFGVVGVLVEAGLRVVLRWVPWVSLLLGVMLAGLGVALLLGRHVKLSLPGPKRASAGRGLRAIFWFGAAYAIASLGCTLPVFLTVVAATASRSNFVSGVASFLVYGIGMSTVLVAVTLAVALARDSLVTRVKGALRYVDRVSGALLLLAGGYLVFYWATVLGRRPGDTQTGTGWSAKLSSQLSTWLNHNSSRVAIITGSVVIAIFVYHLLLRLLPSAHDDEAPDTDDGRCCDPMPASAPDIDVPERQQAPIA